MATLTSEPIYIWVWLPGKTEPISCRGASPEWQLAELPLRQQVPAPT